jgi:hypothetical protein
MPACKEMKLPAGSQGMFLLKGVLDLSLSLGSLGRKQEEK